IALDEPTNHLDMHAIAWLAEHVRNRWANNTGALLVVTHDRWFLDAVCTLTWEVHDGVVDTYEGGYAAYVLQRVERARIAAATEQKRQNLMRKELAWLRRGAPARTSKPKFRIDAANQLIADVPEIRNPIELKRLAVARLGKDVIDLEDAGVTYPAGGLAGDAAPGAEPGNAASGDAAPGAEPGTAGAVEVLRDVTWRIAPGERTGILGANGAGKSTLLGLICGTLAPTQGRVKIGKTVRIGLLDQQFSQLSDIGGDRVREVLARTKTSFTVEGKDLTPAQLLERLGFDRAHLATYVQDLSGGQKRRLQLLLLLLSEPNVIVLDEPTNDVDHEMLTALEDLLDSWPGTLIVVSHDRYLMERITDQQYAIIDGRLRHLPGGVEQYLRLTETAGISTDDGGRGEAAPTGQSNQAGSADSRGPAGGKPASEGAATAPALSGAQRFAAQKECAALERKIAKWEREIAALDEAMAAEPDYQKLQELGGQRRTLEDSVAAAEERWLELSEQAAL
ncbi:MAG: ATP-binding cassette domain-containing protein, partial [Bowdeniella nasicola]|nr:ATP-binding cassette domain-containing protein [Bowdeniella nasicola]